MLDLNDYHAFKSTTGGNSGNGGGGIGCGGNGIIWLLVIAGVLWMIGKLAG